MWSHPNNILPGGLSGNLSTGTLINIKIKIKLCSQLLFFNTIHSLEQTYKLVVELHIWFDWASYIHLLAEDKYFLLDLLKFINDEINLKY